MFRQIAREIVLFEKPTCAPVPEELLTKKLINYGVPGDEENKTVNSIDVSHSFFYQHRG
jgi:hypothetical protein